MDGAAPCSVSLPLEPRDGSVCQYHFNYFPVGGGVIVQAETSDNSVRPHGPQKFYRPLGAGAELKQKGGKKEIKKILFSNKCLIPSR